MFAPHIQISKKARKELPKLTFKITGSLDEIGEGFIGSARVKSRVKPTDGS